MDDKVYETNWMTFQTIFLPNFLLFKAWSWLIVHLNFTEKFRKTKSMPFCLYQLKNIESKTLTCGCEEVELPVLYHELLKKFEIIIYGVLKYFLLDHAILKSLFCIP
jgi:hypothetical protein